MWLSEELLDHVNQHEKSPTDVFVLYDIACSLYKYIHTYLQMFIEGASNIIQSMALSLLITFCECHSLLQNCRLHSVLEKRILCTTAVISHFAVCFILSPYKIAGVEFFRETLSNGGTPQQQKLALCHSIAQYAIHIFRNCVIIVLYLFRLGTKLQELEKQHHVPHRWVLTDVEYMEVQSSFSMEKKNQISEALWATCARRLFLLKLKSRYAGTEVSAQVLFHAIYFCYYGRWSEDC